MGDLVKTIPASEMIATFEVLDAKGVTRDHLKRFRGASSWFQQQIAEALKSCNENFFQAKRESGLPIWIPLGKNRITVNLGATPRMPFDSAVLVSHLGDGWTLLELRRGSLYIDGHKVKLYLSKRQRGSGFLTGYELCEELTNKPVLNANVLDALYENVHMIPADWKKDERGNIRFIYFLATRYSDRSGCEYVRYLYFSDDGWHRDCHWLDSGWSSRQPTAVLAGPSVLVP